MNEAEDTDCHVPHMNDSNLAYRQGAGYGLSRHT